jgi:hypothetical protein
LIAAHLATTHHANQHAALNLSTAQYHNGEYGSKAVLHSVKHMNAQETATPDALARI